MKTGVRICSIAILFGITFFSCKKDKTDTSNSTITPAPCVSFSGYTGRDALNNLTGIIDAADWRLDDTWIQCEKDLFNGSNYNSNCTFDDTLLTSPAAFPNPTSNIFNIDIGIEVLTADTNLMHALAHHDSTIVVDLTILNQRFQVLSSVRTNKYQLNRSYFSLNSLDGIPTDTIFRVYYKLTDSNDCVRMGHGDVVRRY